MRAWVSKHLLYLPLQALRGERVLRHLRDLEASQWESREVLAERQALRLRQTLLRAAREVPFYRDRFGAAGVDVAAVRGPEDLARLPILEKAELRAAGRRLVAAAAGGRFDRRRTSGSTGVPLLLLKPRDASARIRAIWYRYLRWYGIDIGSRQARLLGHPVDRRARLREDLQDLILNKHRLDPVHLTPERMRGYFAALRRTPPTHFYGYPSAMEAFARFLIEDGADPRRCGAGVLVCTGETLHAFQRDFLAASYGARVVNEYGCTEAGVIAFPCPEQGRLHVSVDNLVIEVLAGDRAARPGEPGEVVLTELYSADAPLVRYRLGDVVVPDEARPCPCGRGLPTLARIDGRTSEMIRLGDGRLVHSEVFAYLADAFSTRHPGIRNFRVRQAQADDFRLELVAAETLGAEALAAIAALARGVLGAGVRLEVRQVPRLERDSSGKLRYFVRDRAAAKEPEEVR